MLIHEFHWMAERLFKFDGNVFEHFLDEPWTADLWWSMQVSLVLLYIWCKD